MIKESKTRQSRYHQMSFRVSPTWNSNQSCRSHQEKPPSLPSPPTPPPPNEPLSQNSPIRIKSDQCRPHHHTSKTRLVPSPPSPPPPCPTSPPERERIRAGRRHLQSDALKPEVIFDWAESGRWSRPEASAGYTGTSPPAEQLVGTSSP